MKATNRVRLALVVFVALATWFGIAPRAGAHCDTLDGPVVTAARKALAEGKVNLVLIWVQKQDEAEIRKAFEKTVAVRKLGPEARDLADMYFFETLVRIHRAGEGAPYTGLKPAGNIGTAIPMADKAIERGTIEPVAKLLSGALHKGLQKRFDELQARKNFKADDVAAGRRYISAYVEFIHYVEGIHGAMHTSDQAHEPAKTTTHEHH
jgi:hypothetical protein